MKIVHIITRLLRAGSEENTISSCLGQVANGHEVYLIHGRDFYPGHYDEVPKSIKLVEIESIVHPINPVMDGRAVQQLVRQFELIKPDVVHTHQSKAGIIGRFAARLARVPVVIHTVHIAPFLNVGPAQKLIYVGLEKVAARFTDIIINVSDGMKEACLRVGVGRPEQHRVIHSGMNIGKFQTAKPDSNWRNTIDWVGTGSPRIALCLAALEQRKRQVELIEALAPLIAEKPDFRLILAGEGPERVRVEETIARLGLAQQVKLLGYHERPEELIALADVGVLTSTREGLPRVVIQFLAAGTPIVINHLPGLEEIIANGVNGVVLPEDDIDAAARALVATLYDDEALGKLKRGARETDVSSWTVEAMCSKINDVYEKALSAKFA